jgi:hypothetical protein
MINRRKAFVANIDNSDNDEDFDKITSYCEKGKDFGFNHLLNPCIYSDEKFSYDADNGYNIQNADNSKSTIKI